MNPPFTIYIERPRLHRWRIIGLTLRYLEGWPPEDPSNPWDTEGEPNELHIEVALLWTVGIIINLGIPAE